MARGFHVRKRCTERGHAWRKTHSAWAEPYQFCTRLRCDAVRISPRFAEGKSAPYLAALRQPLLEQGRPLVIEDSPE